jgi:5-methylcytosine-specific restriction protein A
VSSDERIRGERLQLIRRRWFALHPLCVLCLAADPPRIRVATELDHRIPLHKGGADDSTNRQGLCKECHAAKTSVDRGWAPAAACDANGLPLDPRHHWNRPHG